MEHSGLLTADSLVDVLQSLAKAAPQGILEVSSFDRNLEIWIDEGIIVAVKERKIPVAKSIAEKLEAASKISYQPDCDDVAEMASELEDEISINEFLLAKRTIELDFLYSLRMCADDSFYKFSSCIFGPEDLEECTLAIAPSKLLLDFFELEPLDDWFDGVFPNSWDETIQLDSNTLAAAELTADEELIKASIETCSSIKEVYDCSLLTELEFKSALKSLHSKVVCEVDLEQIAKEHKRKIQPKKADLVNVKNPDQKPIIEDKVSPLVTTNEPEERRNRDTMSMTIKRKWSMFNISLINDKRAARAAQVVAGVSLLAVMYAFSSFVSILHDIFLLFTTAF